MPQPLTPAMSTKTANALCRVIECKLDRQPGLPHHVDAAGAPDRRIGGAHPGLPNVGACYCDRCPPLVSAEPFYLHPSGTRLYSEAHQTVLSVRPSGRPNTTNSPVRHDFSIHQLEHVGGTLVARRGI
jgi:hypothetical protein